MGGGVSALKKAKKNPADSEANRIWSDMDADNGGTLTVKEIQDVLKKHYPDYTFSKIKAAVDHFDKDKDGKINREEFAEALCALEINTARVKPGQKAPKRQWSFKIAEPAPVALERQPSAPLVADNTEELTEEDLTKAEEIMRQRRAKAAEEADMAKEAAAVADRQAAEKGEQERRATAAADAERKAKIDAKIAEVQASLAARDSAKQEEERSKLGMADRAKALEAEKAAERARKAQEFIDAEKAKQKPGGPAPAADPALAARAEKLAQLKAEEAEMMKKEADEERKQREKREADKRSKELRGCN